MKQIIGSRLRLILLMGTACACSDVALEGLPPPPPQEVDNKLSVSGNICTEPPEDLVFPVRVLFLVDCSESMQVNDPPDIETGETGKERAVRETVERLMTGNNDVKASIIRFSSESQPITAEMTDDGQFTSYFTDDLDFIRTRLPLLAETDRTTNFLRALSEAYAEIRFELMNADQESLALSTYHVIMVTDGLPDDEDEEARENSDENIIESVTALMELGRLFHLGKMTVNTALIATGTSVVDLAAEELLKAMAEEGGGVYRSFTSGGELNFVDVDLSALRRVFTLSTLVAENNNVAAKAASLLPDSDGDGIDDETERVIASDIFNPDSDGDGCRDGMEYRLRASGLDPIYTGDCLCLTPDYCFDENANGLCDCEDEDTNGDGVAEPVTEGTCCQDADGDGLCDCIDVDADGLCDPSNYKDSDGDGLNDCEERYTGTSRAGADTDGDGLVDFLEIRFGTSPDIYDIYDDLDWDGVMNGEEVRTATDPKGSTLSRAKMAYRYSLIERDVVVEGQSCYEFKISNISLSQVSAGTEADHTKGPAGQGYHGGNRILIYAGEVPFDDPESYARFRVACVEARFVNKGSYKNPPSGHVEIDTSDFVALSEFDADMHCIPPGGRR